MVMKDAVDAVANNLKGSPVVFGLVLINVVFVVLMWFTLREVGDSIERRDAMIQTIIAHCYGTPEKDK
jgi:hypothetical protein